MSIPAASGSKIRGTGEVRAFRIRFGFGIVSPRQPQTGRVCLLSNLLNGISACDKRCHQWCEHETRNQAHLRACMASTTENTAYFPLASWPGRAYRLFAPSSLTGATLDQGSWLIWPHFGRLMWPHLIYSDRSSYPVPASRDGESDGQETQGGTV